MAGILFIDRDGKNVRIVDHSVFYQPPIFSAVGRFIGSPPGSGINRLTVLRVNRKRTDINGHRVG